MMGPARRSSLESRVRYKIGWLIRVAETALADVRAIAETERQVKNRYCDYCW
jgi:hypothetical protein